MINFKKIEQIFEFLLWNFRFFVLLPVIFGLLSTLKLFVIASLEIWQGIQLGFDRYDPEGEKTVKIVSYIIGGIDYYLIGIVLLIFSFGIYELFISKIDLRVQDEETNILEINSFEELKNKLIKVIVVALIVSLFKKLFSLDIKSTVDLVYLATSILIVSASSYLMQAKPYKKPSEK
ncbi:MAG: YqhA family protein [Xenococcaceae cyanobacterium]